MCETTLDGVAGMGEAYVEQAVRVGLLAPEEAVGLPGGVLRAVYVWVRVLDAGTGLDVLAATASAVRAFRSLSGDELVAVRGLAGAGWPGPLDDLVAAAQGVLA